LSVTDRTRPSLYANLHIQIIENREFHASIREEWRENGRPKKLAELRRVITENLRVQRDGEAIDYVNVGGAMEDASSVKTMPSLHVAAAERHFYCIAQPEVFGRI
jgi:hypothetical protein